MEKLSWHTHEYHHTEKTVDWYWIVSIVSISVAIIAIILNNIIFAILIIVSAFTLMLFASKRPEIIEVTIENTGVTIGKYHYPYSNLESFWIETKEHIPRMIFKSKKIFMPLIVVFIEDVPAEKIHEQLSKNLKEEEHSEPFLEKLLIYLGF